MSFTPKKDAVYFLPLGGLGEIGGNAYLYGVGGKWLMVDCGLNFPDRSTPGVDILLPDISFAVQHKKDLAGLLITHGHEDHIGAIPYLWQRLGCPIYATPFVASLLRRKLKEAGLLQQVELIEVPPRADFSIGPFDLQLINVAHSIPDAHAVVIKTAQGNFLHTGDWKIDPHPLVGHITDEKSFRDLEVLGLICDSTNVLKPGFSGSEKTVRQKLIELVGGIHTTIAVACFSSNVARVASIIKAAHQNDREVCLIGRSLKNNVESAAETNLLNITRDFVDERDAAQLPRDKVLYICTGCQGEPRAAMSRIAAQSYKNVRLIEGDVAIFSSMNIPGNEVNILRVQNLLAAHGVEVITYELEGVHVSGHPCEGELRQMYEWTSPQIAIPMHGEEHHLIKHAGLAKDLNVPQVLQCCNGSIVEIKNKKARVIGQLDIAARGIEESGEVALDGIRMLERKRMNYAGAAVVTVLRHKRDLTFQLPVTVSVFGLYDEEKEKQEIETKIAEDVKMMLGNLQENKREDQAYIEEGIRITMRRTLKKITGKKPVLGVQLIWVV